MSLSYKSIINILTLTLLILYSEQIAAQDDYEIQVYTSDIIQKGHTIFELHSNFTPKGNRQYSENIFPSDKIVHETLEITHGFSDVFEMGIYFFNAIGSNGRSGYGGSHIRPRFKAPESWNLPVGLSLGSEIGYQRIGFFNNHWLFEIHPIIDKELGRFYIAINPTFDWNIDRSNDVEFNPCLMTSYKISKKADLALEWYSGYGQIRDFLPYDQQHQVLFMATNLRLGNNWEFNAGIGRGLNASTDPWIIKCIVGRTFAF